VDKKRLSCTTVTFGGKLPEKLRAMRDAGFVATEFWPKDYYEHNEGPDVAINALAQYGLTPLAYQCLRNFEGMPDALRSRKTAIARQLFDQMNSIGCETVVLCSNIAPDCSGDLQSGQCPAGALKVEAYSGPARLRRVRRPTSSSAATSARRQPWLPRGCRS